MTKPKPRPGLLCIPRGFITDHFERALATPVNVRSTLKHEYIRADDPALPELINDAEHYADPFGPRTCDFGPCPVHLAAKQLLAALARQGAYAGKYAHLTSAGGRTYR